MSVWNIYKKLPVFLQALIAAILSFTLNITICILLFISMYIIFKNMNTFDNVLGISNTRLENVINIGRNSE